MQSTAIVGLLCPFIGILNDRYGVRVNSTLAMIGLALCGAAVSFFEIYDNSTKFWYLLVAHSMLSWWETTLFYGISHLYGVYSATHAVGFVKTADMLASLVFLPAILNLPCL